MTRQIEERAAAADAKTEVLDTLLFRLRGDADEDEFLRSGERIGPYLTCLRGLSFEREHRAWCLRIAAVLRERQAGSPSRPTGTSAPSRRAAGPGRSPRGEG